MKKKPATPTKTKKKSTPVFLDEGQVLWLKAQASGISGTIRALVFEAMNLDNLRKSVSRKTRSQKPEARKRK